MRTEPNGSQAESEMVSWMWAPIRSRTLSSPVRVPLRPRLVRVRLAPGRAAAAAIQKAAEEKSPGTLKSRPWSRVPPRTLTVLPLPSGLRSITGGAWKKARSRSVWSREGVFSVTLVVPLAKSPARSRHDFNCALATGRV